MNIVFFGFMGAGKTVTAKIVANLLRMDYVSTDEEIVKREKRTIKRIFEEDKEEYFRKVEKEVVKDVSGMDSVVVDTGGGVILDDENISNLKKNGLLILLEATPEVILERVKNDSNRPLLEVNDKLGKIKEILNIRSSYYKKIPIKIDTSDIGTSDVAEKVLCIYQDEIGKLRK